VERYLPSQILFKRDPETGDDEDDEDSDSDDDDEGTSVVKKAGARKRK